MGQFSHSRVETYKACPYLYKLRYVDKLKAVPDYDNAANPLFVGTAMHTGAQAGVLAACDEYRSLRMGYSQGHLEECYKFEYLLPKLRDAIPVGEREFEHKIDTPDFVGYIDLIVKNDDGTVDIYDFKYSNNVDKYLESPQIHLYRYYYELENPGVKVRNIGYIFIPKTMIRQKKTETQQEFHRRLTETLEGMEIRYVDIPYDVNKVVEYWTDVKHTLEDTDYEKKVGTLCRFCEFAGFCQTGDTLNMLPKNERRSRNPAHNVKVMLYGAPFSGKTYAANTFPDPLFLNTDGNINSFDAPFKELADVVQNVELPGGRITTKVTSSWEEFLNTITELQSESHSYKTVVVDLVDDLYESCRRYMYRKLNITHESDDSFKAWEIIRNEFYAGMNRLTTLGLNVVLICHEDTSRDLCSPRGEKVTAISPNLPEKVANKLSGMVDAVARVINKDGTHQIVFSPDVYSGNRLNVPDVKLENTFDALVALYRKYTNFTAQDEQAEPQQQTAPAPAAAPAPVEVSAAPAAPAAPVAPAATAPRSSAWASQESPYGGVAAAAALSTTARRRTTRTKTAQ